MSITFPTTLDTLTNPTGTDAVTSPDHAGQHSDVNDAVEALEAKVGIDSSAVVTSLDYLVKNALSTDPGHKHPASKIVNTPAGGIVATTVQAAIDELDTEKAPLASPTFTGTVALPATSATSMSIGTLTGVLRADSGTVSVDTDVTDLVSASSTTLAGKVELATTAEINTGTDSTRAMPVDQYVASNRNVRYVLYRVLGNTTNCAAATTVGGDLECPITGTIVEIGGFVDTAGTTGTMVVDVNLAGATIMTTNKLSFDTTEKSTRTAATAPTLTTTAVTAGDIFTVDIDSIHTTAAKGLTIRLGIRLT